MIPNLFHLQQAVIISATQKYFCRNSSICSNQEMLVAVNWFVLFRFLSLDLLTFKVICTYFKDFESLNLYFGIDLGHSSRSSS